MNRILTGPYTIISSITAEAAMMWRKQKASVLHYRTDAIGNWVTENLINKLPGSSLNPPLMDHTEGTFHTLDNKMLPYDHRLNLPVNDLLSAYLTECGSIATV